MESQDTTPVGPGPQIRRTTTPARRLNLTQRAVDRIFAEMVEQLVGAPR